MPGDRRRRREKRDTRRIGFPGRGHHQLSTGRIEDVDLDAIAVGGDLHHEERRTRVQPGEARPDRVGRRAARIEKQGTKPGERPLIGGPRRDRSSIRIRPIRHHRGQSLAQLTRGPTARRLHPSQADPPLVRDRRRDALRELVSKLPDGRPGLLKVGEQAPAEPLQRIIKHRIRVGAARGDDVTVLRPGGRRIEPGRGPDDVRDGDRAVGILGHGHQQHRHAGSGLHRAHHGLGHFEARVRSRPRPGLERTIVQPDDVRHDLPIPDRDRKGGRPRDRPFGNGEREEQVTTADRGRRPDRRRQRIHRRSRRQGDREPDEEGEKQATEAGRTAPANILRRRTDPRTVPGPVDDRSTFRGVRCGPAQVEGSKSHGHSWRPHHATRRPRLGGDPPVSGFRGENDMIGYDEQGGTVFTIHAPGAEVVELTARFGGDHERTLAMRRCGDGGWSLRLHPGLHCSTYRFRVDGRFLAAHDL
ncbi:MAG TPA: hypothetical protein DCG14_08660, partial [Phycisphaerales bacterium]|nr:hypothetical protein [Phycisphaerales bacterium]